MGAAVVLCLLQHGYEVLAHSSDADRSKRLLAKCSELPAEACARLKVTTALVEGVRVRHWIVGKSDARVPNYLPRGAKAVVFSVPDPFDSCRRSDVTVVKGGVLHLDMTRLSAPRQFSNLLASHDA